MPPSIFLLTDFGTSDPFVGIMKAVILGINPNIHLIDLTHEVSPGDLRSGAILLWQSLPYLPDGSVVLCVVDPGVGTARCPILLHSQGYRFIGPDNGIFSYVLDDDYTAWELKNPNLALPQRGTTFHGRDIFAPAAAHAASGVPPERFGAPMDELLRIPQPRLSCPEEGRLEGEVIHIDRFGNALTSLGQFSPAEKGSYKLNPWVGECPQTLINLQRAKVCLPGQPDLFWADNFTSIPKDQGGFIIGSSGLIEIAANRQSAANLLNLALDTKVTLCDWHRSKTGVSHD